MFTHILTFALFTNLRENSVQKMGLHVSLIGHGIQGEV